MLFCTHQNHTELCENKKCCKQKWYRQIKYKFQAQYIFLYTSQTEIINKKRNVFAFITS